VDRRVLRRHLWARIEMDRTWVIGPPGRFLCKLDLGSVGPAGVMVEGVFTFPAHRGKGLARRIVALVASLHLPKYPAVCLHLGAANRAARRAYEAAGMHEVAELRLVLASPPAG
jgi:predicted GNAT family acetyltransferase